jgi:hypothetical protein
MNCSELVHRIREEVIHNQLPTGMALYGNAVLLRKINALKECGPY